MGNAGSDEAHFSMGVKKGPKPSGHLIAGNPVADKHFQFVLLQEKAGDGVAAAV